MLSEACDAAVPRRVTRANKKAVHWWNNDIATPRKSTIAARRQYQRAGRRTNIDNREEAFLEYNQKRKELRILIRKVQEVSWKALCDQVNSDSWGVPYILVM